MSTALLPVPAPLSPPTPRACPTVALVDLDSFYVSVERVREPRLVGRGVIVGGLPGERGVVACASYEARGHGVHAGMPLSEAAALLPRRCAACTAAQARDDPFAGACTRGCPVFLHGSHAAYLEASRRVMALLEGFAPQVEPVSLDEAYLDWTGCERHHRSWLEAAQRLRTAVLEATGLSISVGVGGTRAVAAVAAALAKPAGVLVVRAGEERAFLAALPLEHLPGVGPKMRERLQRFHLLTVGDLAAVPEDLMEATFGRIGPALVRRARGLEDVGGARVGQRTPQSRSISRETSFAEDTDDPRVVDGMLSYLAQRAVRTLRAEGLVARSVGVRLRYADFDTVEARRRLPEPTDLDRPILAQVRALWPARWTRRVRLRLVGVVLHDLEPRRERQLDLPYLTGVPLPSTRPSAEVVSEDTTFPTPVGSSLEIDRAVDRIRDRHGFGAIVRGRAIDLVFPGAGGKPRAPTSRAPRERLPRHATARPGSWSLRGLSLRTPACSR